jgi:hypothetical protein
LEERKEGDEGEEGGEGEEGEKKSAERRRGERREARTTNQNLWTGPHFFNILNISSCDTPCEHKRIKGIIKKKKEKRIYICL